MFTQNIHILLYY